LPKPVERVQNPKYHNNCGGIRIDERVIKKNLHFLTDFASTHTGFVTSRVIHVEIKMEKDYVE
jgi:hypothetical protein